MNIKHYQVLAATTLAILSIAGSTSASVTFFSLGATSGVAPGDPGKGAFETTAVTFDLPSASYITETDFGAPHAALIKQGSVEDVSAAPSGDVTKYEALGTGETATFKFGVMTPQIKTISFYVGSVDLYNTIYILGAHGAKEYTINGSELPAFNGDQGASKTNRRVYISMLPKDFSGIEFASSGIAFEYDDIAISKMSFRYGSGSVFASLGSLQFPDTLRANPFSAGVPEPSAWAMMLTGVSVVGWTRRRRRKGVVTPA